MAFGPQNNACVGGIIADRVEHCTRFTRFGIDADDTRIENFYRRRHIVGRRNHVITRHISTAQWGLQHEGNFGLYARLNEPPLWDRSARFKHHVVKQNSAVGNIDVQRILHRLGRQPNFPTNDIATLFQLGAINRVLDSIGIVHSHVRVVAG